MFVQIAAERASALATTGQSVGSRSDRDATRQFDLTLRPHLLGQEQLESLVAEPGSALLSEQLADQNAGVDDEPHQRRRRPRVTS